MLQFDFKKSKIIFVIKNYFLKKNEIKLIIGNSGHHFKNKNEALKQNWLINFPQPENNENSRIKKFKLFAEGSFYFMIDTWYSTNLEQKYFLIAFLRRYFNSQCYENEIQNKYYQNYNINHSWKFNYNWKWLC